MALAVIYPRSEQGKRGTSVNFTEVGVSAEYVQHARVVLQVTPDVVPYVMDGTTPLDAAYADALKIREEKTSAAPLQGPAGHGRRSWPRASG
jgi:hypothetical protein